MVRIKKLRSRTATNKIFQVYGQLYTFSAASATRDNPHSIPQLHIC